MTPQTLVFHVIDYHDCDGCRKKVKSAVGNDLLRFDIEKGHVTVLTSNPNAIRRSLERKMHRDVVLLSPINSSQELCILSEEGSHRHHHSNANKAAKLDNTTSMISRANSSTSISNINAVKDKTDKSAIIIDPQQRTEIMITIAVDAQPV